MRKLRHREAKESHPANKWQSWTVGLPLYMGIRVTSAGVAGDETVCVNC